MSIAHAFIVAMYVDHSLQNIPLYSLSAYEKMKVTKASV